LLAFALLLAAPVFVTFAQTGLVPRFPTAIAATGVTILAFLSLACAFILDSVRHGRLETRRLFYLRLPAGEEDLAKAFVADVKRMFSDGIASARRY